LIYKVDGTTYHDLEDVICCIRVEARNAREENKESFEIETNSFEGWFKGEHHENII